MEQGEFSQVLNIDVNGVSHAHKQNWKAGTSNTV